MNVVWTGHAEQRLAEWQPRLGVTKEDIEMLVIDPAQVVPGDAGALVAQDRRQGGLLRVVFREEEDVRRVVTLYWTSRAERYWRG